MKKLINSSLIYAILALISGVYYREFTKFQAFTGNTKLSTVHTHLLVLGTIMFLIVILFEKNFSISKSKNYSLFLKTYNIGLIITILMMLINGTIEVLGNSIHPALSGIAGIGHIIIGIGFVALILSIKESINKIS